MARNQSDEKILVYKLLILSLCLIIDKVMRLIKI